MILWLEFHNGKRIFYPNMTAAVEAIEKDRTLGVGTINIKMDMEKEPQQIKVRIGKSTPEIDWLYKPSLIDKMWEKIWDMSPCSLILKIRNFAIKCCRKILDHDLYEKITDILYSREVMRFIQQLDEWEYRIQCWQGQDIWIVPGVIIEDCGYCPVRVAEFDGDDIEGISMVNGVQRGCSKRHCGVILLSEEEAELWVKKGPQSVDTRDWGNDKWWENHDG